MHLVAAIFFDYIQSSNWDFVTLHIGSTWGVSLRREPAFLHRDRPPESSKGAKTRKQSIEGHSRPFIYVWAAALRNFSNKIDDSANLWKFWFAIEEQRKTFSADFLKNSNYFILYKTFFAVINRNKLPMTLKLLQFFYPKFCLFEVSIYCGSCNVPRRLKQKTLGPLALIEIRLRRPLLAILSVTPSQH